MSDKRTPDNNKSDEIKGGGNPFVDYDFYLHPEKSADKTSAPEKKKAPPSNGQAKRRPANTQPVRPSQRSTQPAANKPASKVQRPHAVYAQTPPPPKPWYTRAREAIVRFYSTKRPLKVTLTVIIALILIAVIVILSFAYGILGMVHTGGDDDESRDAVFENESNFAMMTDPTSQSFRAMLKEWATTGEKMHSSNVVNILLMGMDGSSDDVNSAAHSDAMIIASVNKRTQTITLASIYRDCLTYANINDNDRYLKLTEVSIYDTLSATAETIENDFKIEIDDYVAVNFNTFPKIIDAVGGVTVEITDDEYRWLLNHEGINVGGSGTQTLNGEEALAYSRIRYLDSDVKRAERQRKVLTSLLNASKSASSSQISSMLDVLLPNVATSMSRTGILSLATQAFAGQWYNYQIKSVDIPSSDARYGQSGVQTSVSSGVWVWLVDYPLAAQEMQMALYGSTNIELDENRVTAIDVYLGRSGSGGSGSSGGSSGGSSSSGGNTSDDDTTDPTRVSSGGSGDDPETETETQTERVTETEEPTGDESTTNEPPHTTTQPDEGGNNGGDEPEV